MLLKDKMLDNIAMQGGNVAQFVSFSPKGKQRYSRIRGISPTKKFRSVVDAIEVLKKTGAPYINIRSFLPEKPDGNPFIMGRKGFSDTKKIADKVHELMKEGYYIILNEEVDVLDGGYSGVLLGNSAEFATRDTPRCVEKAGCAVLPRSKIFEFTRVIYGDSFILHVPFPRNCRVEFSVHPNVVGYAKQHLVIWQYEECDGAVVMSEPIPNWPNRVSEDMGDKAYGILMAYLYGFRVPQTTVVGRLIPPFTFGQKTHSSETCWRRTCPTTQQPGLYTTKHGQLDPFALMLNEDPSGKNIAAMVFQDDIPALYSGAVITGADGNPIIEGKAGNGDDFMTGSEGPVGSLPDYVKDAVSYIWEEVCYHFTSARFEWVYGKDGSVWIVQLHVGQSESSGNIIFGGEPETWITFQVSDGLESLRKLVQDSKVNGNGVILKGNVGLTSHFGDLLRRNKIPSRLEHE